MQMITGKPLNIHEQFQTKGKKQLECIIKKNPQNSVIYMITNTVAVVAYGNCYKKSWSHKKENQGSRGRRLEHLTKDKVEECLLTWPKSFHCLNGSAGML